MKLVFKGIVSLGDDPCRCGRADDGEKEGSIWIGDHDIVNEIEDAMYRFFNGEKRKLIIGIADETFEGELFVQTGWGYSEWTPMESDELKVGEHDLIEILERYEGQNITMFISDEPINILEEF